MTLELEQTLSPYFGAQQSMKVSPRLVAANYILELSSQELQQAIATELLDNPAFEVVDVPTCRVCGTEMRVPSVPAAFSSRSRAARRQWATITRPTPTMDPKVAVPRTRSSIR